MKSSVLALAMLGALAPTAMALTPKMVATQVDSTSDTAFGAVASTEEELSAPFFVTSASCSTAQTVRFPLDGGRGRGAVIVGGEGIIASISLVDQETDATLTVDTENPEYNVFGIDQPLAETPEFAISFQFEDVAADGEVVEITCTTEELSPIVVVMRDDSDVSLTGTMKVMDDAAQTVELALPEGTDASTYLAGEEFTGRKGHASFKKRTKSSVTVEHTTEESEDVVLVQAAMTDSNGNKVRRTFISTLGKKAETVAEATVESTEVDETTGDLVIVFGGIDCEQPLKITARLAIEADGETVDCVDISGIVEDKTLTVHSDWFSVCLDNMGLSQDSDFNVVLTNAVVTDPNGAYAAKNQLTESATVEESVGRRLRRNLAAKAPVKEITKEMLEGRKPEKKRRNLQVSGGHAKILVHGYCSDGNPFTLSDFSNAVAFVDPDGEAPDSWSNDEFARKIDTFADNNDIDGCGCIGHSQGGLACLHLYANYFSCLDEADQGGSRLIQSVGSPYRGTAIAGSIASIGDVFGAGCGTQSDLTESGATSWLSGISTSARNEVHYYTTGFENTGWWTNDYCNFFSDLVLSDPEDGVVESDRGQLSGGNNRGFTEGECHTTGMRDPSQTESSSRNSEMDSNAMY